MSAIYIILSWLGELGRCWCQKASFTELGAEVSSDRCLLSPVVSCVFPNMLLEWKQPTVLPICVIIFHIDIDVAGRWLPSQSSIPSTPYSKAWSCILTLNNGMWATSASSAYQELPILELLLFPHLQCWPHLEDGRAAIGMDFWMSTWVESCLLACMLTVELLQKREIDFFAVWAARLLHLLLNHLPTRFI